MIQKFNGYVAEKVIYPLNRRLRLFIGELRRLGYPNPFNSQEIIVDDILGIEVKIASDKVWITNVHMLDKRKSKATDIIKKLFDVAKEHNITIGILPFPAQDAGLSQNELLKWFSTLGFIKFEGKYVRNP